MKQTDETEIIDDDEDALILQQQPSETVMSIGHESMLHSLNTKFVARRSDVIVSSTMSFTMTPVDAFDKIQLASFNREEIKQWVDIRQESRREKVFQAHILSREEIEAIESEDSVIEEADFTENGLSAFEFSVADASRFTSEGNERMA